MAKLDEIVRENIGKSSYSMNYFFQSMIDKKELEAYSVRTNEQIIEKDDGEERIVKVKKGATLIPIKEIEERRDIFIKDKITDTFYYLNIQSSGGSFSEDGSQTIYHNCTLERLSKKTDFRKINNGGHNGLSIPGEFIDAKLRVSYSDDWDGGGETDFISGSRGKFVIEGEKDGLFEKVYDFVKGK